MEKDGKFFSALNNLKIISKRKRFFEDNLINMRKIENKKESKFKNN